MHLRDFSSSLRLFRILDPGLVVPKLVLYFLVPGTLILALAIGYALRRFIHRVRLKTKTSRADLSLAILEALPIPLVVLAAIYTLLEVLVLPPVYERIGSKLIFGLVVVVVFYIVSKAIVTFMHHLALRDPTLERVTQPVAFVIRLLFIILGTVIILENLNVHLEAVWATLGIGSVAVALGLQETLSNAFAGFYIMADQPVGPGDYVKLDSGHEGYVVRIGWRATSLRTLGNNVIYVPNAGLAKAVITNYSKPEERMSLTIPVSVAYGTEPARVEAALLDIARQAANGSVEGLLAQPEPSVRFIPGFGASSLDFSLSVQVRRFVDQYPVQSELRKRIVERFAQEKIEMPFPTRTILLNEAVPHSVRGRQDGE